jgi:hypothetical protein
MGIWNLITGRDELEQDPSEIDETLGYDEEDVEDDEDEGDLITEQDAEAMLDEMIDETTPTVTICGYDYDPSRVLKIVDPAAYREQLLGYMDSLASDGKRVEGYE